MLNFKDNFSKQAVTYAKYRPSYPPELFDYLSSLTKEHNLAWDCATGNGQAAVSLTNHYKKVFATDPSENQIKNAIFHSQIEYKVEQAEQCSLAKNSVDLITIAQALHWFDFDVFYKEAKRVLKSGGIIAAIAYKVPLISTEVDNVIRYFHDVVLDNYWLDENRMIEKEYSTIPFPFTEIKSPEFIMQKELTFDHIFGHVKSWSALQRYIKENNSDPSISLEKELKTAWGSDEKKEVIWKLILKIGQNND